MIKYSTRLRFREDTSANWTLTNPILASGEPGFEKDTGKYKLGDGTHRWNELSYLGTLTQAQGDLAETSPNRVEFIKNKSTKYLANEGEDGTSPYATQEWVSEHASGAIDTIKVNGVEQQIIDKSVDISVPTKTSDITNDSDFVDSQYVEEHGGKINTISINSDTLPIENKNVNIVANTDIADNTNLIQSKAIYDNLNRNIVTDVNIITTADNVSIEKSFRNISTKDTSTDTQAIPLVDSENAGLMSYTDYNTLNDLQSRVEHLEGTTVRLLYTAKTNPSAQEINDFVEEAGYLEPFTGIAVVIAGTYHIWHYYTNDDIGWRDDGLDTVEQFGLNKPGVITGADDDGKVYAESDGTGSVKGWDNLTNRVTDIETNKADSSELSNYQPLISSGNKLSSDLVDDTNNTNKFVTAGEKTQITTNATNISTIQSAYLKNATVANNTLTITKQDGATVDFQVKVDDVTVDRNSQGQLEVKNGGITNAKLNSALKATSISDSPSNDKLATESAIYNYIASGNNGKPRALDGVDLNTINATGFYSCNVCTNRPTENNGVMLVLKNAASSDNTVQIYWTFVADVMWVRHKDLGNWKAWKKVLKADDIDLSNYYDKTETDNLLDTKADKVTNATNGNFAGLDANGNLTDSGKKASDFSPNVITGTIAPTNATVGQLGQFYLDTVTKKLYQCKAIDTSVTPNTYEWEETGGGSGKYLHHITINKFSVPKYYASLDVILSTGEQCNSENKLRTYTSADYGSGEKWFNCSGEVDGKTVSRLYIDGQQTYIYYQNYISSSIKINNINYNIYSTAKISGEVVVSYNSTITDLVIQL